MFQSQVLDPTGGMPITPCDIYSVTFSCNVYNTACKDANPPFHIPDGNGVVLRGDQVAPLEAKDSSVAMLIEASTILTAEGDASDDSAVGTHTVTVTATSKSSLETFSAADVAGAAVGAGVPFLIALLGAVVLIFHQRRKMKEMKSALAERENMERSAYGRIMQRQPSAPIYGASSVSNQLNHHHVQQHGRFVPEMENSNINEMGTETRVLEIDSRQQGPK